LPKKIGGIEDMNKIDMPKIGGIEDMNKIFKILMMIIIGIIMLSTMGNAIPYEEWNKTYRQIFSTYNNSVSNDIIQTSDGGYIVVGKTCKTEYDCSSYMFKTDVQGNIKWKKGYGPDSIVSVKQNPDGGYILARQYGDYVVTIIKTDNNGNVQWKKILKNFTFPDIGNHVVYIQRTLEGGYMLVGYEDVFNIDPPPSFYLSGWLIKTDANGKKLWEKRYGNTIAYTGQQIRYGNYIIAGERRLNDLEDVFYASLIKTDASGNKLWEKTFGEGMFRSAEQIRDGGYILGGQTPWPSNYALLIKIDGNGNILWRRTYGNGIVNSVRQTIDGGYIIAGQNNGKAWIAKTDGNSNILWNKFYFIGSSINSIRQTKDNGYIAAGNKIINSKDSVWLIKLVDNLLKNPGFEETYNSMPRYWNKYQTGTKAIFTYPEIGRTGTGKSVAIKYTIKELGKTALWSQPGITVLPSKQYKLSGYMRLNNVTGGGTGRLNGADLRVNWYKSDGGLIKVDLITKSGTSTWTKYEKIFTSPLNAVRVTVGGDLFNASGKVWFDDLSFTKIS
jgi:hypothetical protein